MFTGIVEEVAKITKIEKEQGNVHFTLNCSFIKELQIDQSVAHNGACLTVVELLDKEYVVTAIDETMRKTNLGDWKIGDFVNLERSMMMNGRLDGHIVQGHVDQIGILDKVEDENGSFKLYISYESKEFVTVPKGSICVNGVSLTVVDSKPGMFSIAIIPYTWEHTNLGKLNVGDKVNLEFDILGKYVQQLMQK